MKIRTFLVATVAAASLAAPALADNIQLNQWYSGFFTGTPSPLTGAGAYGTHGPVLPGGFANAVGAPTAPWSITLSKAGTLTVTDVQTSGDQFTLYDNGVAMTPAASPFTAAGQNPGQPASPGVTPPRRVLVVRPASQISTTHSGIPTIAREPSRSSPARTQ